VSEPISFRIVKDLQTALRAISVANGYFYDVASIAVKNDPNSAANALKAPGAPRPLLLIQVDPERREYQPAGELRMVLPLVINWVQESDATDDDSRMRTFFRGCADVEKAIAPDDGGPGRSRGGLAIDTTIVRCINNDDIDGSQVWAQIEVEIPLFRQYGRPNG
jgi:hypothetical protein